MGLDTKNNITCVIGKSGSGKTWLIRDLVRGNADFFPGKIFIWGGRANYGSYYGLHKSQIAVSDLSHLTKKSTKKAKIIIWESSDFDHCLAALVALSSKGKVWFVCDEIDRQYKSKNTIIETIASLVHTGRHELAFDGEGFPVYGVSVVFGFRRLQNTPNDILSNAHTIYLKKIVKLGDIKTVNREIGEEDLDPSLVRSLEPPNFMRFDDGNFSEESDLFKLKISEDTKEGSVSRTIQSRWKPIREVT